MHSSSLAAGVLLTKFLKEVQGIDNCQKKSQLFPVGEAGGNPPLTPAARGRVLGPGTLGVWYFSPSFKESITPVTWDVHRVGQPDLYPLCWPQSPPFLSPPAPCNDMQGSCERAGLPVRALCLTQADRGRLLNMSLSSFLLTCPSFS